MQLLLEACLGTDGDGAGLDGLVKDLRKAAGVDGEVGEALAGGKG